MAYLDRPEDEMLDFAYRYSFTREARELASRLSHGFESKFLRDGALRVEEALSDRETVFVRVNIRDIKQAYLMSYAYSRMLVSAMNSRLALSRYTDAEARRARSALEDDTIENVMKVAEELNSGIEYRDGEFVVGFENYLKNLPRAKGALLTLQDLGGGHVYMARERALDLLESMIRKEIAKNLPIPVKEMPREVVEYSRRIKMPQIRIGTSAGRPANDRRYAWIERLLATPIPDVRHRTVNLILAPYLVNIKNLNEDDAAGLIINYIERCKAVDPNTRINANYIRYQCRYAKSRGLRPLSFERAKELLGGMLNLEDFDR